MMAKMLLPLVLVVVGCAHAQLEEEEEARNFLQGMGQRSSQECSAKAFSEWTYASDINEQTRQASLDSSLKYAKFKKELWNNVTRFNWRQFRDPDLRRQFHFLSVLGTAVLPDAQLKDYELVISGMETIYSTAKVCSYKNPSQCDLNLEPDLVEALATSRDYNELEYIWTQWRNQTGRKMRSLFQKYAELRNNIARQNNFTDNSEYWLMSYESPSFREDVERLWKQLKPLYEQLHAYVRRKLREVYGEDKVTKTGPIPAHLLGNMWSQSWGNILSISEPFPGKQSVDVTPQMKEQGYTPEKMFQVSEEFFTSLNLTAMPQEFWQGSIIEKPRDREIICHASAWDFCNRKDFRIKQCTRVTMEDLITVHHEMGHIQYFLQYKDQPLVYREGANPGFHEAVGDVLALSVSTPKHLKKIGLLDDVKEDPEMDLNFLFSMALEKIAFLPFGYLMDLWRWDVFSGKIAPENYNCGWWKYRLEYQGIRPPNARTEEDFDPGAKYHIGASVPYIRYFVSFVIQFQFHKALCLIANEYDPSDPNRALHKCDIYKSSEAGNRLGAMLQLGMSKPWPEAMEVLTATREMDAGPLLEYFRPLHEWLEKENARTGESIGWNTDGEYCGPSSAAPPALHHFVATFIFFCLSMLLYRSQIIAQTLN